MTEVLEVDSSLGGSGATFTGAADEVAEGAAGDVWAWVVGTAEDSSSSPSQSPSSSPSPVAEGAADETTEVGEAAAEERLAGLHLASRFLSRVSPFFIGWQQSSKNWVLCWVGQLIFQ